MEMHDTHTDMTNTESTAAMNPAAAEGAREAASENAHEAASENKTGKGSGRRADRKRAKRSGRIVSRISSRGGSYSLAVTAIVIAILVAVNVLASVLPSTLTKYDITSTNLYSVTSSTKVVVNNMDKDVTIYWVVQADKEDSVIENLLDKYESLSDHITVIKKNPDAYPTFTAQYTDETVPNNSIIVECGDKNRYISYDDIYLDRKSVV